MPTKNILVIGGPTGVGESTVTNEIIKRYPKYSRLISATSRPPRVNEQDKVDYYFFTEKEFIEEIKRGNIIEFQNTRKGIYYGSFKPELDNKLNARLNIIVNPDVVGAKYYKKNYNATTIFIMPESIEVISKRLKSRDPNIEPDRLTERIEYAKYEMENESPFYDFHITNKQDELEATVDEVIEIIKSEGYSLK